MPLLDQNLHLLGLEKYDKSVHNAKKCLYWFAGMYPKYHFLNYSAFQIHISLRELVNLKHIDQETKDMINRMIVMFNQDNVALTRLPLNLSKRWVSKMWVRKTMRQIVTIIKNKHLSQSNHFGFNLYSECHSFLEKTDDVLYDHHIQIYNKIVMQYRDHYGIQVVEYHD